MATTLDEILYEEMLDVLHHEAVMKNEALKQCIYVFVEGDSEETVIGHFLELAGIDVEGDGIIIANYNGIGNLPHALRLLNKTLSHDRPIVVTFDDDLEGKRVESKITGPLLHPFKIPQTPVVNYSETSRGGSFEEAFESNSFLEASFGGGAIDRNIENLKSKFKKSFDPSIPWIRQLAQFHIDNEAQPKYINKVKIAENQMKHCKSVPPTFLKLAELVFDLRKKHPIKHPDEVDY